MSEVLSRELDDFTRLTRLIDAVIAIYSAGHWSCDRVVDEYALWNELKRAAGIPHGTAPVPFARQLKA